MFCDIEMLPVVHSSVQLNQQKDQQNHQCLSIPRFLTYLPKRLTSVTPRVSHTAWILTFLQVVFIVNTL